MKKFSQLMCALALSGLTLLANAQGYSPDVYEFGGSGGLAFDPAPELSMGTGGTIEFWVGADWQTDPGYDPVILANAGEQGASYLIAMLRDRDGLAFVSGSQEEVVTFNFADGRFHHVALRIWPQEGIDVMVDGKFVGSADINVQDLPSAGLWLGTMDGSSSPYVGAIAALRIWRPVLPAEVLIEYSMQDVFASVHPNIDQLIAISDFSSGQLLVVQPQ